MFHDLERKVVCILIEGAAIFAALITNEESVGALVSVLMPIVMTAGNGLKLYHSSNELKECKRALEELGFDVANDALDSPEYERFAALDIMQMRRIRDKKSAMIGLCIGIVLLAAWFVFALPFIIRESQYWYFGD